GPESPQPRVTPTRRVTQPKLRNPEGQALGTRSVQRCQDGRVVQGSRLKISESRVRIPLLTFYSISMRAQEACCYAR
ncbi:Chaperone protein HscA-like protein, partial [Frankliniella fusca]